MSVRLLQAMAGAKQGGAELYFVRLARALHDAGVDQRIVTRPNDARDAMLRAAGLEPVHAPFGGPLDRRTGRVLSREIAAFEPDVVLSFMSRATAKCPKGGFVHVARLGGFYDLKYYRGCDHLIANTKGIADYLIGAGWPAERVTVIGNFVDDRRGVAPAERAAHDTPEGAPLIFTLGRLHRNKAFDVLIDALDALPEAYLWLAGDGPEAATLRARAQERGVEARIRFLGWQDDPAPLFAAADVFALPSRHEPLGNVLIEAWAHGLPVVTAASQGPLELVVDGETAVIVPIDDAAALTTSLRRIIDDRALAERLGMAGRAAFEASFTEAAIVKQYLAFFDAVRR